MDSERISLSWIRKPREDRWCLGTIWEACFSQKQHYSIDSTISFELNQNHIRWLNPLWSLKKSGTFLFFPGSSSLPTSQGQWSLTWLWEQWRLFPHTSPVWVAAKIPENQISTLIPSILKYPARRVVDPSTPLFSNRFHPCFLNIWIFPGTVLLFRRFAGYKKMIAWNNKTRCRRLPVWSGRFRGISGDGMILPVKPRPSTLMAWRGNEKNIHFGCGTDGDRPDFLLPDRGWRRRFYRTCPTDPGSAVWGLSWYLGRKRTVCRHDLGSQSMIRDRHEHLFIFLKPQ